MSIKANYFKIGLFVSVGFLLTVVGMTLFGAGVLVKEHVYVETYFDQSVQGLDVGSPVKHRGVKIGTVDKISILSREFGMTADSTDFLKFAKYVYVRIALEQGRMQGNRSDIRRTLNTWVHDLGLRLKLAPIGLTGLKYIEADYHNPAEHPPMQISWEPIEYYVPSVPGTIERLEESVLDLSKVTKEEVIPLLQNLQQASEEFPRIAVRVNDTMDNVRQITGDLKDITTTAKKYPSHFVFGDAPPKSRYDQ